MLSASNNDAISRNLNDMEKEEIIRLPSMPELSLPIPTKLSPLKQRAAAAANAFWEDAYPLPFPPQSASVHQYVDPSAVVAHSLPPLDSLPMPCYSQPSQAYYIPSQSVLAPISWSPTTYEHSQTETEESSLSTSSSVSSLSNLDKTSVRKNRNRISAAKLRHKKKVIACSRICFHVPND